MDAMKVLEALEHARLDEQVVTVHRAVEDDAEVDMIPLAFGDDLLVGVHVRDLQLDGYVAVPLTEVERVETTPTLAFASKAIRAEGWMQPFRAAVTPPVEDWRALIEHVADEHGVATFELEHRDIEDDRFFLGRIEGGNPDIVTVLCVDSEGVVEERLTVPLGEVTRVQFGDRYSQTYRKHAEWPAD